MKKVYAPLYHVPAAEAGDSPVVWDYERMKRQAGQLNGYVKFRIALPSALALAEKSSYPRGVKLAVMKQISNTKEITLEQMRIILGWAARKSQHTGR